MARGEKTAEMFKKKKKKKEGNTQTHTCVHTLMGLHTQKTETKKKKTVPVPQSKPFWGEPAAQRRTLSPCVSAHFYDHYPNQQFERTTKKKQNFSNALPPSLPADALVYLKIYICSRLS